MAVLSAVAALRHTVKLFSKQPDLGLRAFRDLRSENWPIPHLSVATETELAYFYFQSFENYFK
jgi:hypothetical protein